MAKLFKVNNTAKVTIVFELTLQLQMSALCALLDGDTSVCFFDFDPGLILSCCWIVDLLSLGFRCDDDIFGLD